MKAQSLILTLVLVTILSLSIGLLWHMAPRPRQTSYSQPPAMYMSSLRQYHTGPQGRLLSVLEAPRFDYYDDLKQAYVTRPCVTYYPRDQKPWHAQAEMAISHNQSRIDLARDVRMHQQSSAKSPATSVKTSRATIYPQQNYAITDQLVTIKQNKSVLQARGAWFNYKTQQLHLNSQARGRYEPPRTH